MESKIGFFLMIFALVMMMVIVTSKSLTNMEIYLWFLFCFVIMAFGVIIQTPLYRYFVESREQEGQSFS